MMRFIFFPFALLIALGQPAFADAMQGGRAAKPGGAATAVIKAGDKDALAAAMNQRVAVVGEVASAAWNGSGSVFSIKFKNAEASKFEGVVFAKNRKALESALHRDLGAALNGAVVRLTGKLQMYRNHPEIIISDPAQITLGNNAGQAAAVDPQAAPPDNGPAQVEGIYAKLRLTNEQREKIAAIQKDADEKIDELLNETQRKQAAVLKEREKRARKD